MALWGGPCNKQPLLKILPKSLQMGEAGATPDTAALSGPQGSKRPCLSTSDMLMTFISSSSSLPYLVP